jgi:UPF0755 protein
MADNDPSDTPETPERRRFGRLSLRSPREAIQPEAPPPPPPRQPRERGRLVDALSGFLTFVLVAAIAVGFGFYVLNRQFYAPGPLGSDKVVIVKGGSSTVAETLQREGVIEHPWLFIAGLKLFDSQNEIKAGEYLFKQQASLRDVMDTLVAGKSVMHTVTFPEGLTSEQIVQRLKDEDVLTGNIKDIPPEGSLLPETYKVQRGTTREQLLERMGQEQKRVLKEIWSHRAPDLPIKTPEELVTLASIVEKETGKADERPRVARVFINRLQKNMRLQSDPTIVYGLIGGKGVLGHGLQRAEIDKPTPYNTYQINGLPPGPIANPGRAAMEAVANPSRTKELYFVADGTGGHVFAETLEQHQRNVTRWRQIEASRPKTDNDADAKPGFETPTAPDGKGAADNKGTDSKGADGQPVKGTLSPSGAIKPMAGSGATAQAATGRPRAFDASEGTPNDPLLNKTYDLNSPQKVPDLKR